MSDIESTRRTFEDAVRDAWTIGYGCPRLGEGYENVHVNSMWAIWKTALATNQGAAEPVAQVSEVDGKKCVTFYSYKALYDTPLWTKLYATPPAVMPAAPSDALPEDLTVEDIRAIRNAFPVGAGYTTNIIRKAFEWGKETAREQIAAPAAGEQAGAVALPAGWELTQSDDRYILRKPGEGAGAFTIEDPSVRVGVAAMFFRDLLTAPGAAIAAREQEAPSDEDMVNAAYCLHKYRQGTDNGIAFNRGARWMRAALTQPTTVQQAETASAIEQSKFFWDGKEVSEREYLRRKFCLCGARNADGKLQCQRCLKALRSAIKNMRPVERKDDEA